MFLSWAAFSGVAIETFVAHCSHQALIGSRNGRNTVSRCVSIVTVLRLLTNRFTFQAIDYRLDVSCRLFKKPFAGFGVLLKSRHPLSPAARFYSIAMSFDLANPHYPACECEKSLRLRLKFRKTS